MDDLDDKALDEALAIFREQVGLPGPCANVDKASEPRCGYCGPCESRRDTYLAKVFPALVDAVRKARAKIAAVRALHEEGRDAWLRPACVGCGQAWPCKTIRALDRDGATKGEPNGE